MMITTVCSWLTTLLSLAPNISADEVPKPSVSFSVKPDGVVRTDVQWMEFTPSGKYLAIRYTHPRSPDATLEVFDANNGKSQASTTIKSGGGLENRRTACAIDPGGGWIAYTDEQHIRYLGLPPGKPRFPGKEAVALSSVPITVGASIRLGVKTKKKTPAFLYRSEALFPTVEKWDLVTESRVVVLREPELEAAFSAHSFNPTASHLALSFTLGANKHQIRCWSLVEESCLATTETKSLAVSLAYSSDGMTLAAGFGDGSVALYNAATLKTPKKPQMLGCRFSVSCLCFHPSDKYLVCGTNDRGAPNLFFLELASNKVIASLIADANGITDVCFSPSGERVAAFGGSGNVTIWDASVILKLQQN